MTNNTPALARIKERLTVPFTHSRSQYEMCQHDITFLLQGVERLECDVKSYMEDWQLEYKLHHETKQKLAQAEVSNYDLRRYTDVLNESRAKAEARCRELEQAQLAELWCPSMGKCQQIIENLQDQLKQQEGAR